MKHYIFNNKKNDTNNKFFTFDFTTKKDPSEALDELILSDVIKRNPYLANIGKPKDTITSDMIDILLTKPLYGKYMIPNHTLYNITKANKTYSLLSAIRLLLDQNNYGSYELPDGTTIRFFGDEVQIDDTIFSLEDSKLLMEALKPKTKKTIIDFVISIKH